MSHTVLVTGATGFVGRRLVPALIEQGHTVRAMTRHPETYDGPGEAVGGDVSDPGTLADPLNGVDVAVYLVHSLDDDDFERKDAEAAKAFGLAAAASGVRQIVYLGGLGKDGDDLSAHLRSRREVERLLGESEVPVTVLRAAIVVGAGGISWELTRQLVKNLPAMVVPKW
ncbi:MAG: NAD-dependent epimerase/dehydratase family protein, partial [Actinomycetales bacterium]